jgi:M6 family metalloprotease-like protein
MQFGSIKTNFYLLTGLGSGPNDLTIGTFCHENGHLLCRFPDMYDYGNRDGDGVSSAGIGSYCLMGAGNHLNNGRTPAPVCAYLRDLAGWCDTRRRSYATRCEAGETRRLPHRHEIPDGQVQRVFHRREPDARSGLDDASAV